MHPTVASELGRFIFVHETTAPTHEAAMFAGKSPDRGVKRIVCRARELVNIIHDDQAMVRSDLNIVHRDRRTIDRDGSAIVRDRLRQPGN